MKLEQYENLAVRACESIAAFDDASEQDVIEALARVGDATAMLAGKFRGQRAARLEAREKALEGDLARRMARDAKLKKDAASG